LRPIQRQAVPHQPLTEIGTVHRAGRHCSPVAIESDRKAVHQPFRDAGVKIIHSRMLPAFAPSPPKEVLRKNEWDFALHQLTQRRFG
jgi:hypothetical protein